MPDYSAVQERPAPLAGRVALVTGAARGQGRSHALRLARDGADIIAVDIAAQIPTVPFPMSTPADLEETARLVRGTGRQIAAIPCDVRDRVGLATAVRTGVEQLGRLDVVVANAGIFGYGSLDGLSETEFRDVLDVNLIGMWHTITVALPFLREHGDGGSIVLCSSTAALKGMAGIGHYVVAKHGVTGLLRTAAIELAPESIRVNSVHPSAVDTPMIQNDATYAVFGADLPPEQRTREAMAGRLGALNKLPVPWLEPDEVSAVVAWLASDEARHITGSEFKIDAGESL